MKPAGSSALTAIGRSAAELMAEILCLLLLVNRIEVCGLQSQLAPPWHRSTPSKPA